MALIKERFRVFYNDYKHFVQVSSCYIYKIQFTSWNLSLSWFALLVNKCKPVFRFKKSSKAAKFRQWKHMWVILVMSRIAQKGLEPFPKEMTVFSTSVNSKIFTSFSQPMRCKFLACQINLCLLSLKSFYSSLTIYYAALTIKYTSLAKYVSKQLFPLYLYSSFPVICPSFKHTLCSRRIFSTFTSSAPSLVPTFDTEDDGAGL